MSNTSQHPPFSIFADRQDEPSYGRILEVLGRARPAWSDLELHLREKYALEGFLRFMYGKRYGWALCFRRGGRFITAMYPNRGSMTVQIILNRAQIETVHRLGPPPHIKHTLEKARDYPEGRWLFLPVTSRTEGRDLRALIELKLQGRKRS
jgi:Protein of unknown function (DUF3788)